MLLSWLSVMREALVIYRNPTLELYNTKLNVRQILLL